MGRVVAIVLAFGVLLVAYTLYANHTDWLVIVIAAFLLAILAGCNGMLDGMQIATRQRAVVAWRQGAGQWMRLVCALILVKLICPTSSWVIIGYVLAVIIVLCSQYIFFQRTITNNIEASIEGVDAEWRTRLLTYARPFSIWGVFTWIHLSSDRWILEKLCATSDVGFYGVLYRLGYAPILLSAGILEQFLAPVLFRRAGDGSDRACENS